MFVSENTLSASKRYFFDRLEAIFSPSELKSMWTQIICKRMKWTPTELLLKQQERLSESDLLFVRSFVKGLLQQVPFQYLLGETSFFGLTISCDSRALIPRPETEELVDWVRASVKNPKVILDLCTGSGCIALALKSIFRTTQVSAIDLSKDALDLAQENAKKLALSIQFYQKDVLKWDVDFAHEFQELDVIVSNPPYIPNHERVTMSAHVLEHEPAMALFVEDADPILFYKKILDFAELHLKSGGLLFFELHESFGQQVKFYAESKSFKEIEIRDDLQGKARMMKAQKA